MTKDEKYVNRAIRLSRKSLSIQQKMAAIVVSGGRILSEEVNHRDKHAEARALRRFLTDMKGATIYVGRWNGRCSKPCPNCSNKIKKSGVKRVVYINWSMQITEEKL